MTELMTLGKDCSGQPITPINNDVELRIFKNRHPNTDGTSWGWIEGCTLHVCWSNNSNFNHVKARKLVNDWNNRKENQNDRVDETV